MYGVCPENYPKLASVITALEHCSNDGIHCQGCQCLSSCVYWWDSLVSGYDDRDLDAGRYSQVIAEVADWQRYKRAAVFQSGSELAIADPRGQ